MIFGIQFDNFFQPLPKKQAGKAQTRMTKYAHPIELPFCLVEDKWQVYLPRLPTGVQGMAAVVPGETSQPPPSALINWTLAVNCCIWRFNTVT